MKWPEKALTPEVVLKLPPRHSTRCKIAPAVTNAQLQLAEPTTKLLSFPFRRNFYGKDEIISCQHRESDQEQPIE